MADEFALLKRCFGVEDPPAAEPPAKADVVFSMRADSAAMEGGRGPLC